MSQERKFPPPDLALTGARAATTIMEVAAAQAASEALWHAEPELSARVLPRLSLALCLISLLLSFCLLRSLGGFYALCAGLALAVPMGGALALRLLALKAGLALRENFAPSLAEEDLPSYTLLVPLFHEAAIVPRLMEALERLSYPRERLQILLLLEEEDQETRIALHSLALGAHVTLVIAPKGEPQTKPRALNIGLGLARGDLTTIYDAEDNPDPQQLRQVAAFFARAPQNLACVQCPLHIDNADDSWIAAIFALEYAALFDLLDPGLADLGLPVPLGGTSNHFRTTVLRQLCGWDAWNVTEDADMGVRLARSGFAVGTLACPTDEEAPAVRDAWISQRKRWMKGWLQTLIVLLRHPGRLIGELGLVRALSIVILLLGGVLGPLVGIWLMGLFIFDALLGSLLQPVTALDTAASLLWCLIAAAGALVAVIPLWLGARKRGLQHLLIWLPLLPAYYTLLSYAALLGIVDYIRRPHYWDKTDHGLAVHSLRGKQGSVDLTDPAA